MSGITDPERGIAARGTDPTPKRMGPGTDTHRASTRAAVPASGKGNPGSFEGTESRNGLLYAKYKAKPGTWVSASMADVGYDRVYGRDTAYGAYTGIVLSPDGKPLKTPDRIEPGQEYLIPIGSAGPASPAKPTDTRPTASTDRRLEPVHLPPAAGGSTADRIARRTDEAPARGAERKLPERLRDAERITPEPPSLDPPRLFTSAGATSKCYTPYPLDPNYSDMFGIIAHTLIQADYVKTLGLKRERNVWTDDNFAGRRNKKFSNFLINKNLKNLTPAQRAAIKRYRGQRPDILLDTGAERGFEEIKPNHQAAIDRGVDQVETVRRFLQANNLPYSLGTSYVPKAELRVLEFRLAGEIVEAYLKCERKQGLIVYHYCFRADWARLKRNVRKAMNLFIEIMVVLLYLAQYGRTPVSPPPGTLPPQLPEPSPIKNPIIMPPDKVPVSSTRLSGYIPDETMRALKGLPLDVLDAAARNNEIIFEPYVER